MPIASITTIGDRLTELEWKHGITAPIQPFPPADSTDQKLTALEQKYGVMGDSANWRPQHIEPPTEMLTPEQREQLAARKTTEPRSWQPEWQRVYEAHMRTAGTDPFKAVEKQNKEFFNYVTRLPQKLYADVKIGIGNLNQHRLSQTGNAWSAWLKNISASILENTSQDPIDRLNAQSLREQAGQLQAAVDYYKTKSETEAENILGYQVPEPVAKWIKSGRKFPPPSNPEEAFADFSAKVIETLAASKFFGRLFGVGKTTTTTAIVPHWQTRGTVPLGYSFDPGKISTANQILREGLAFGSSLASVEALSKDATPGSISKSFATGFVAAPAFRLATNLVKMGAAEIGRFHQQLVDRLNIGRTKISINVGEMPRAKVETIKASILKQPPEKIIDLVKVPEYIIPGGQMGGVYVAPGSPGLSPSQAVAATIASSQKAYAAAPGFAAVPSQPEGRIPPPAVDLPEAPTKKVRTPEPTGTVPKIEGFKPAKPEISPSLLSVPAGEPMEPTGTIAPAKPGKPISEQIQLTPAQRTQIAMVAREQGAAAARELSNKLLAGRSKQLGRELYGKPIADVEGLIRYARTHEVKAVDRVTRESFRAGQISLQATHRELIDFAKTYLPTDEAGKILPALAGARTPAQVRRAAQSINRIIKNYDLRLTLDDFKEAKKGIDIKNLPEPQRQQIESLLADFTETTVSDKLLRRMQSVLDAAGDPEELGIPQKLIERAQATLIRAGQKPLRSLNPDDIRGITASMQAIAHAAETKLRLKYNRKFESAQQAMEQAAADVLNLNPPLKKGGKAIEIEGGEPGKWTPNRLMGAIRRLLTVEIFPPGYWTNKIAGNKGPAYEILESGPRESEKQSKRIVHSVQDYLKIRLDQEAHIDFTEWKVLADWSADIARSALSLSEQLADKAKGVRTRATLLTVNLPTARSVTTNNRVPSIELTKAELGGLYLTIGDMETRQQLLYAGQQGVTFYRGGPAIKFTEADLWALVDQIPADVKKVADIHQEALYELAKRDVAPVWLEDHGFPFRTKRDHWGRIRDSEWREAEPSKAIGYWRQRYLDNMSIFKHRAYADEPFLVRDMFTQFAGELSMASQYAGKQLAYQDAIRLLHNRDFRNAVKSRFKQGETYLRFLEDEIDAFQGLDRIQQTPWGKAINRFTSRATTGLLAFNPATPIIMPISSLNFFVYTDLKHFEGALGMPFGKNFRDELARRSPVLRDRFSDTGQFLFAPGMQGESVAALYGAKHKGIAETGMDILHFMDTFGIENGAKLFWAEGQRSGLEGEALWDFVVAKAEEATDLSQAGQTIMTTTGLARMARQHPTLHLAMLFTAETQKIFSVPFREYDNYRHSAKTWADKTRFAKALVIPSLLGTALVVAVREGINYITRGGPPPEKPKDWNDRLWELSKTILGYYPLAGKRLVGLLEIIQTALENKSLYSARTGQDPLEDAFLSFGRASGHLVNLGQELKSKEVFKGGPYKDKRKWIRSLDQASTELARLSGLLGLPIYNPYRITRRMIQGESQAKRDYETNRAINALAAKEKPDKKRMKQISQRLKDTSLNEVMSIFDKSWVEQGNKKGSPSHKLAKNRIRQRWNQLE